MPEISAVVLAGGKSQRLGLDKSLLEFEGEWLLQRILRELATLSHDLLVVADGQEKLTSLQVPVISDARPEVGPLGGIYSGLQAMRHERGLFVACDMPLLNLRLLEYMIQLSPEFDVVIPRIGDETEPLHAIYSKACVRPIGDLLDRGQRRVIRFFHQVRVRYVERDEIEAFDPEHLSFFNINTPADLQRGQQLFRQASRSCSRTSSLRTLVVGYGNLDRGDDGVAYYVVNALRQRLEQGPLKEDQTGLEELDAQIDSIFLTQLVPELINALSNYDQVIFVDAHVLADVPGLHCTQVQPNSASSAFAHHLTPAVLLALLKELYHCQPRGYIVSVRGYDLHFQRGLSAATGALVEPAANCLMRLLCER